MMTTSQVQGYRKKQLLLHRHIAMVRWSYMNGGINLTRGSILVTYLSGINNSIFNKISSSYSTKSHYTNIIQIESHLISQVESIE